MNYIILGIVAIMISGGFYARYREKKKWNNGICKETGLMWKLFTHDSTGARGYNSGDHYMFISYNVDK